MFVNVKNPKWTDAGHCSIFFDVRFAGENDDVVFVASLNDCTTHGPLLYNLAISGVFGPIADSDEERILKGELPLPSNFIIKDGRLVDVAAFEQCATEELNRRLAELSTEESKALAEIDEEYAASRKEKISALLAVKKQSGWPINIGWQTE